MAYSKFNNPLKFNHLFGVQIKGVTNLFSDIPPVEPSTALLTVLDFMLDKSYYSEAERSHSIVAPILTEIINRNKATDRIRLYQGRELNVDSKLGLTGECDYLMSYGTLIDAIEAPLFSAVEAKRQDIEWGTSQCAAQLIGIRRYNERSDCHFPTLYGCSTTGDDWRFIKYEGNTIYFDDHRYQRANLPLILGILQFIVDDTKKYK
ncbi:MAG: hypothetical protein RLZZ292_2802 [Bacteroidota bacterium]|jgi:hypothetical protein